MNPNEYQGWSNWETWNVALYIQNEESLYRLAKSFKDAVSPYDEFRYVVIDDLEIFRTPDGVSYCDPILNKRELNRMIREL